MISYRGHAQQDIIQSLVQACELAQKHSPGPACDAEIDAVLAEIPHLQSAADDDAFRAALKNSDISILQRMHELFEVYAIDNTDGIGRQVFKSLHAWDAFSGFITADLRPVDSEIMLYQFTQGIRRLGSVDEASVRDLVSRSGYITNEPEISGALTDLQALVAAVKNGASDQTLAQHYRDMGVDAAAGRIVRLVVERSGSDPSLYQKDNPWFSRYGIVLEDMVTGARFHDVSQKNEALIKDVYDFVAPFFETDTAEPTLTLGCITADPQAAGGIVLSLTKDVAQALANAFPDRKLIHHDGSPVLPAGTKNPVTPRKPSI